VTAGALAGVACVTCLSLASAEGPSSGEAAPIGSVAPSPSPPPSVPPRPVGPVTPPPGAPSHDAGSRWVYAAAIAGLVTGGILAYRKRRA